ncbi:hypothetical protein A2U01_0060368, partial [Trifolium medium]|nr:hypothetical protein [Trifolium medium]
EETEEEEPVFKRKRTKPVQEETDPEKAQPASEHMETDADTGISKSINDNVPVFKLKTLLYLHL